MSARARDRRCDHCDRAAAKKRLTPTAVGLVCPHCLDRLPRRLRKPARGDR